MAHKGILYIQMCSVENLKRACFRVAGKGSRPGPDGIQAQYVLTEIDRFVSELREDLLSGGYVPSKPSLETKRYGIHSEKMIAYHVLNARDRVVEYAIKGMLSPLYENIFSPISCAYRVNRGEKYFYSLVNELKRSGNVWFLTVDIKSFFNSIDCSILLDDLLSFTKDRDLVDLIAMCLAIGNKADGLPSGHILAPFLSNVYLHPVDIKLDVTTALRYADNYCFARSNQIGYDKDISLIERLLKPRKLVLNHEKTRLIHDPNPEALIYG